MQLPARLHNFSTGANFPQQDPREGKYVLRPVHPITSAQPNLQSWNKNLPPSAPSGPGVLGWSPLPYSPQEDPHRVPFSQVFSSTIQRASQQPSQVGPTPQQEAIRPKQSTLNANAPVFVFSSGKASRNQQRTTRPGLLINSRRGWRSPEHELSPLCHIPRKMLGFAPKNHPHNSRGRANAFNTHLDHRVPRNFGSFGAVQSSNLVRKYKLSPPDDNDCGGFRGGIGPVSSRISRTYINDNEQPSACSTVDEIKVRPEIINPNSNSRNAGESKPRIVRSKEERCAVKHCLPNSKKHVRDMNLSRGEKGAQGSQRSNAPGPNPGRGGGRRNASGSNRNSRLKPWALKRRGNDRFIVTHHGATIIRQYSGKLSNLGLHNQMQIIILQKCAATIGILPYSVHTLVLQECNVDIKKMKAAISTMIVQDCSPKLDYLPCSVRNLVLLRSCSALDFLPQSVWNLVICDSTVNLDRLPDSCREIALRNIFADRKLLPSKAVVFKLRGKGTQNLSDRAMVRILSSIVTWVPSELLLVVADFAVEKVEYLHNIAELARGDKRKAFAEYQLLERQVLDARRMYYE